MNTPTTKVSIVVAVLTDAPRPLLAAAVATRAGLAPHDASRILSRLAAQGRVSCAKRLGAYSLYELPPADARVVARMRFLRELLELPAFQGNCVLGEILADYQQRQQAPQPQRPAAQRRHSAPAGWRDPFFNDSRSTFIAP